MAFKDALTSVAWNSYVVAPKVAEWESREAVSNLADAVWATIWGIQTMTQNVLEHSFKEVWYPIRNNIADFTHFLRHPIKTVNQDSISFIPKSIAAPFTTILSSTTGAIRSVLEAPEDLSRGLWQTPIDATTAGTVWQLWLPGRMLHYAWKAISTPPRLFFHYTTSLLGKAVDIAWDSLAKLTQLDATPESWKKYVTPSTFSFNNSSGSDNTPDPLPEAA